MWAVLFYSIFTACPLTIHRIHHWLNSKIVQQSNILTSSHHHILIRPLTSPSPISDHKPHSTATTTRKRNEKKNCIRKSQRYKNKRYTKICNENNREEIYDRAQCLREPLDLATQSILIVGFGNWKRNASDDHRTTDSSSTTVGKTMAHLGISSMFHIVLLLVCHFRIAVRIDPWDVVRKESQWATEDMHGMGNRPTVQN